MMLRNRRRHGTLTSAQSGRTADPLAAISWSHVWWAAGPRFKALGLADGAAVTTFPDEVGSADMTRSAAGPVYRASAASLTSRPAVETDGVEVLRTAAAAISVTLTYSVAWVGRHIAGGTALVGGQTEASAVVPMLQFFTFAAAGAGAIFGAASGSTVLGTGQRVWTTVITSGDDFSRMASTTGTGTGGSTLLTRLALGGYADMGGANESQTQTHFLGVYQGNLLLHPRFAEWERWAAAGGAT